VKFEISKFQCIFKISVRIHFLVLTIFLICVFILIKKYLIDNNILRINIQLNDLNIAREIVQNLK